MRQSKIRRIKHTTIQLGDLIRVTGKLRDMAVSRTGTVTKRDHDGHGTTEYMTERGVRLLTVFKDGSCDLTGVIVTRLQETSENMLPGFDNMSLTINTETARI